MSRKIITDIIIPIIQDLLSKQYGSAFQGVDIRDEQLINFLESQLTRRFSLAGEIGGRCSQLETMLKELQQRDPEALREIVRRILDLYINLRLTETQIEDKGLPNPYFGKRTKPKEIIKVV